MTFAWWEGEALASPFAFDTETRMVRDDLDVPDLALLVACDGGRRVCVHPDDAGAFLARHSRHTMYGYNVAFDFWTLAPYGRVLWRAADEGRLLCLRMLWRLLKLAARGEPDRRGTLADCCEEFGVGPVPDKSDPYRMRYGELIGLPKGAIDAHPEAGGFLTYALNDAEATYNLIAPMTLAANSLMKRYAALMRPDAGAKWGPLSVALQTRADIAFDRLSREPLRLDTAAVAEMTTKVKARLAELQTTLEEGCPGLWKRYRRPPHAYCHAKGSDLPQRCEGPLVEKLRGLSPAATPLTPKGKVSTSAKEWVQILPDDPWVRDWAEYELLKKRLSVMLRPMAEGVIYANYETLLRTGRTAAARHRSLPGVPVQQVPRDNAYRRLFLADEGCARITADYSYLELRTLAACCLWRFGASKLADAVKAHSEGKSPMDPHEVTGAAVLGVDAAGWANLPPAERKAARQLAKPVNFGYPGGLMPKAFVSYAKAQYKADVTLDQAKALRETWLDAYPEMRQWLEDRTAENLAENLGVTRRDVAAKFGSRMWRVRSAIEGWVSREAAEPVIARLYGLAKSPAARDLLGTFDHSEEAHERLSRLLLRGVSVTPTGRVRARCTHNEAANNPFQGLAADGAKEALWRLMYAGYRVKAFIHDEVIVDAPTAAAPCVRRRVHEIMDGAMQDVMGKGVPCRSESHCGPTWVKG